MAAAPETIELHNRLTAQNAEDSSSSSSGESDDDEFDECDCPDEQKRPNTIPYSSVYDDLKDVRRRGYFVPALPVTAKIVKAERDTTGTAHPINRYTYTINLTHGQYEWTIHRRYGDFFELNNRLKLFHAGAKLKSPFKKLRRRQARHRDEERGGVETLRYTDGGDLIDGWPTDEEMVLIPSTIANSTETQLSFRPTSTPVPVVTGNGEPVEGGVEPGAVEAPKTDATPQKPKKRHKLPDFPTLPDSFVSEEHLEERKTRLQDYLSAVLHIHAYRDHHATAEFAGVSRLSFVHNLGCKHCEGYIKQRPGGEYALHKIRNFCLTHCCKWKKRWLVVKDSFVASLHDDDEAVYDVVLYDADFKAVTNPMSGPGNDHKGLIISNLQRDLVIKCHDPEEAEAWRQEVSHVSKEKGDIWLQPHRFGSSFPERESSYAQWFVDGRSFMEHAANMMEIAREEIFIADWWLTPHIYLKRPMKDEHWRLDNVLKRKAEAGVRVFVMVYKEVTLALGLNSYFTETYLTSLHPNIRVMRHPNHVYTGVLYWAHHEKVLVVDQQIAFVGGIDLCFGRWDDHFHRLTDLGYGEDLEYDDQTDLVEELRRRYQSQDSQSPPYHTPPQSPSAVESESFLPSDTPETSRRVHFEAPEAAGAENADGSVAVPPLNVAEIFRTRYRRLESIEKGRRYAAGISEPTKTVSVLGDKILWPGKDYVNFIHKDIPEPEKPFEDFVDRTAIPRLPWHDISSVVYGSAARDVARHFIQRWNSTKLDAFHVDVAYPLLIPKSYDNIHVPDIFCRMSTACLAQILRSVSMWSAGISATECSIQQAYLAMIQEAQHFIYIENQFFISQLGGTDVLNQISNALFDRIVRAHRNRETFRVYIVMPLLPAFERQSGSLQVVLHWTYVSISKGPRALMTRLRQEIGDPSPYITFCSLRTHAKLVDKLVTELVYIHSKLIIVDDRFCLIGSANVNDRSQMGDRDSEVALFVEDTEFTKSEANEQWSGAFAGSLRRRLFSEHLGLLKHDSPSQGFDISDPVSSRFFQLWNSIAKSNTQIYEKVFECAPSDRLRTIEQFALNEQRVTLADRDPETASRLLSNVQGYLVQFPLHFLIDSDLAPSITTPEGLTPSFVFV